MDRKAALEELLFGVDRVGPIRFSDHYVGRGAEFFEQACSLMLEGIVSKRAGAPYRSGRSPDWLKIKCTKRHEFVIGGWRRSTASGRDLGSLLVGYYRDGKLEYAGKIGTGFSQKRVLAPLADVHYLRKAITAPVHPATRMAKASPSMLGLNGQPLMNAIT